MFIIIVIFIAPNPPPGEIVRAMAYFVLALPGSAIAVALRRRFLRLPKQRQLAIAWASLVATALAFAYLVSVAAR